MALIGFLILFPLVIAGLLMVVRQNTARNVIVLVSSIAIGVTSVVFILINLGAPLTILPFYSDLVDHFCTLTSIGVALIILYFCYKHSHVSAAILTTALAVGAFVLELVFAPTFEAPKGLYYDSFSLLMASIIGVIGSGICVYSIGYMEDFQAHQPEGEPDRRHSFFAIMFLLLSAMFGIVFCNNMVWMFAAWEVTSMCSFLLIGYTQTEEAVNNAFRQIIMNMLGGLGFLIALYVCAIEIGTFSFHDFLIRGTSGGPAFALAATLLAFAGITKAAQMPFQSWLLGAMVAPTPTSALLHSSTMVKAGVFLLVKLSPIFLVCAIPSLMVVLVGGITFLLCSFLAISQSNAKRVLAYSTIANLGLITACAGVGTPEAVWAAAFLIMFHAIAKSLLFLGVGTAEHNIGSRDIESMDLLFDRMPHLARLMMLGIMGMFLAPFGMLIAKWATLVSFADSGQIALIIILAFGSGATFMFWAKWMGKLAGIAGTQENIEGKVHRSEWAALGLMAVLLVVCTGLMPVISMLLVNPYILSVFGLLGIGQDISMSDLWFVSLCMIFVVVAMFFGLGKSKARRVSVYLSGIGVDHDARSFKNSMSGITVATSRNWYMEEFFGEQKVVPLGVVVNSAILVICIAIMSVMLGIAV